MLRCGYCAVHINAPLSIKYSNLCQCLCLFLFLSYNAFMQINNIQENSFKGKVKFNKKLTKPMVEYANKILDQPFSGTTARERIAKSSYDVEIQGRVSKKTVHPKLFFASDFKILKDPKSFSYTSEFTYYSPSKGVSIHSTVAEGANKLNEHLTKFEEYKGWYPYAYNTFGEKVSAFFKRMFGIRK